MFWGEGRKCFYKASTCCKEINKAKTENRSLVKGKEDIGGHGKKSSGHVLEGEVTLLSFVENLRCGFIMCA